MRTLPGRQRFRLLVALLTILVLGFGLIPAAAQDGGAALFGDTNVQLDANPQHDPTVVRSRFVTVNFDLLGGAAADAAGAKRALLLNLFNDVNLSAALDRTEPTASGGYSWIGHVVGAPLSSVTLVVNQGIVMGNIVTLDAHYQVRMAGGLHVVHEIDQSRFPQEAPPKTPQLPTVAPQPDPSQMTDDGTIIDVMVLYTPAARSAQGGVAAMNSLIDLAVVETNQAYQNSGINQRINLVHRQEISYTEPAVNPFETALDHLTYADGVIDNVHTLRNTYKADLVSLFIEDTQYCGIAWLMEEVSPSFETHGYSVIARTCATGYYSFAHEMGHNMGARHDWYVDTGTLPYAYAHGYVYTGSPAWRTIMAYGNACSGCARLQYFSNPNRTYNGQPMGVPEGQSQPADNRRTLNNTAYTVANFRTGGSSTITKPTLVTPSGTTGDNTPTFTWNEPSGANRYWLYVAPSCATGNPVLDPFVPDAGGSCNGTTCSYTPGAALPDDTYVWWVQGYAGASPGQWSNPLNFRVSTLGAPGGLTPNSTALTSAPVTFQWNTVSGGTTYRLYIQNAGGTVVHDMTYTAGSVCSAGTCTAAPGVDWTNQVYTWWVQVRNGGQCGGGGTWSGQASFTLNVPAPGATTLVSPAAGAQLASFANPTYQWTPVAHATWYRLYVEGPSGPISQWVTADAACGASSCSHAAGVTLADGQYTWSVRTWGPGGTGPWSASRNFTVGQPLVAPTPIAPTGTVTNPLVTFQWGAVSDVTEYRLYVERSTGEAVLNTPYTPAALGCAGGGTCTVNIDTLANGAYRWYVQAVRGTTRGPWSAGTDFTLSIPAPGATTLVSPAAGAQLASFANPTYQWTPVAHATWYRLYVEGPSGPISQWVTADAACGASSCSHTAGVTLADGQYTWSVRTWGPGGTGPWSASRNFTVGQPLVAPTPIAPTGTVTNMVVSFQWGAVSDVTEYRLYVERSTGEAVLNTPYTPAALGCAGGGTCTVNIDTLANGAYRWYVQALRGATRGPWSAGTDFTLSIPAPGVVTATAPTGTITNPVPTYTWNTVPYATWYRLYVSGPAGVLDKWLEQASVCSGGTCAYTATEFPLTAGAYTWNLRAWGPGGAGPWNAGLTFTYTTGVGGFNSQFNSDASGWGYYGSTPWYMGSTYVYAPGMSGYWASLSYGNSDAERFTNFDYKARLWRAGTNDSSNNLLVRGAATPLLDAERWNTAYAFQYTRNGYFSVWRFNADGTASPVQSWAFTNAIVQGSAWNELRVIANGGVFYFYINGALVWTGADATFGIGHVGISFYAPTTGDTLYADWATLTTIAADAILTNDVVSAEQQALNAKANANPVGDVTGMPDSGSALPSEPPPGFTGGGAPLPAR